MKLRIVPRLFRRLPTDVSPFSTDATNDFKSTVDTVTQDSVAWFVSVEDSTSWMNRAPLRSILDKEFDELSTIVFKAHDFAPCPSLHFFADICCFGSTP